jgi:hypothetical protein
MIKFDVKQENLDRHLPELIDHAKGHDEILAVYLFGSYARNEAGSLSDIDIACLIDSTKVKVNFDFELKLLSDINDLFQTDEVTLVVLNNAPLTIQYGVISDSKLIFCRDEGKRQEFENRIVMIYLDFSYYLKEYDRELLRQLKEGEAFD